MTNRRYPWYVMTLLAAAALLASQPLAAGDLLPIQLDMLTRLMDTPVHRSWVFMGITALALVIAAGFVYSRGLDPYADRRPLGWVWLNAFAPFLFLAAGAAANELSSAVGRGWPMYAALGAALVVPTLVLLIESILVRSFRRLGDSARMRDWRRTAIKFYTWCLRLRPGRTELVRLNGLLHRDEDDHSLAITLLERLGPAERSEDDQVLRALESSYRAEGYLQDALNCLLRLRQLRLDTPGLDRKILDDQIKLGQYEEALTLIESGRLKQNLALQIIRENLELKLGRHDAALASIRRVIEIEQAPFPQGERLLRELIAEDVDAPEPRIELGRLLLRGQDIERRDEGARLLQGVFDGNPERFDLATELMHYFQEQGESELARRYLDLLTEARTPDPELHHDLTRLLTDEGRFEEAELAGRRWLELYPNDFRAHLRLARVLFSRGQLDAMEAELAAAEPLTPPEHDGWLRHLRHDLDLRRREEKLHEMEAAQTEVVNIGEQLSYFDELLCNDRIDTALKLSEELLAQYPDQRAAIIERINTHAAQSEQNFRMLDYLADLYLEDRRLDELLELYRRMAERSLHPDELMKTGCEKILAQAPNHLEARLELAMARRMQQDWVGVMEVMAPLMTNGEGPAPDPAPEPADKALWVEAAFRTGNLEEAIRVGIELADELASEPGFMLLLIDALQAADRHQEASMIYDKAREAAPDDPRLARLARRIATNRRTQRLAQLQAKIGEGGLEPHEHYEKAELHRELGQIGEAIIHYQRAADEEDLAVLALAKMAVSLSEKGMYDMAEEILNPLPLTREIELRHPELKDLFYSVARSLEKIKRPDLASKYYKKIFRVDAAYKDVVTRLERLGS